MAKLKCVECGSEYEIPDEEAGAVLRCRVCKGFICGVCLAKREVCYGDYCLEHIPKG